MFLACIALSSACILPMSLQKKIAGIETATPGEMDGKATGTFPLVPMAIVDEHGNVEIELAASGAMIIDGQEYGKVKGGIYRVPMSSAAYAVESDGSFWMSDESQAVRVGKIVENRLEQFDGTRYVVNSDGSIVLEEKNGNRKFSNKRFREPPTTEAYQTAILLAYIER
jgi:hypothetical protein